MQVSEDDGLPKVMCVQCVLQVSRAFTFKQQCQRSDTRLRDFVRNKEQEDIQAEAVAITQRTILTSITDNALVKNESSPIYTTTSIGHSQNSLVVTTPNSIVQTLNMTHPELNQPLHVQFQDPNNGEKCVLIVHNMAMLDAATCNVIGQEMSVVNSTNHHVRFGNVLLEEHVNAASETPSVVELADLDLENIDEDESTMEVVASFPIVSNINEMEVVDTIYPMESTENDTDLIDGDEKFDTYSESDDCGAGEETMAGDTESIILSNDAVEVMSEHVDEEEQEFDVLQATETACNTSDQNKPFSCKDCDSDQSFGTVAEYKHHMATVHPPAKPFQCNSCQKQFSESKILKRHMKIHSPIKPHVCTVCNMAFAESSNLTKHKKKHTGELRNIIGKPNLCSVCGKRFKWGALRLLTTIILMFIFSSFFLWSFQPVHCRNT